MSSINPYVGFNGQCREAMAFYKDCLGGDLFIQEVAGTPMEAHCPAAMKDKVLHSSLTKNGLVIMATDMTGPGGYVKGNNVALSVNCDSEEDLNSYFKKLSAGGEVIEAPRPQFWGAIFACLNDKFGICWMLNFEQPKT